MSWLRVDDGFTQHPKFAGWSAAERWALLELMTYCARYRTCGKVPNDLSLLPRCVTKSLVNKAVSTGWIDVLADDTSSTGESLWIHDWSKYNPNDPTGAERAQRYRDRNAKRDANRDEDRDDVRDESVTSRARPRARPRPVPSLQEPSVSPSRSLDVAREHDDGTAGRPDENFFEDLAPDFTGALDDLRQGGDDS